MKQANAAERLKDEVTSIENSDQRTGMKIIDKYPTLVTQVLNANSMYVPEFLERMGEVMRHTKSEKAVVRMAEVALKYRRCHPQGSVNAATNITCCLEGIAYYTKSASSVIASANVIATAPRGISANDIADRLSSYAFEHSPEQEVPAMRSARPQARFNRLARKLFPEYNARI